MKKILFVDLASSFGGIENYLASLSQLLTGQAELHAVCINERLREVLREKNVHVVPEHAIKRGKIVNLLIAAFLLIQMRIKFGISIVWVQGYSEIALLPLARMLGCKALATRHLTMSSETRKFTSKMARKLYEHLAFKAHRIFCVSSAVASDLSQLVDEKRLSVIPNWVPSVPELPRTAPQSKGLCLLFVGRLQPHKGAALILDAMRRIQAEEVPTDLSLTIVGEGECRQELEGLAEGLDVHFAGFQKDPSRFYRQADIFINPTLGPEGLPLVSLEAMSYGLPCIFSDLEVHKEISIEGTSAALFAAGNSDDLCTKLLELAKNKSLRAELGNRARSMILSRHTQECAKAAYLKCLDAIARAA
jgi:glycosyltransferase involved in cell wall biosynthesis